MRAIALLLLLGLAAMPALADDTVARSNAIAVLAKPALPPDFPHFPYVNPTAPKGGEVTLASIGTYDSFKIEGTLKADGMLVFSTTRWWSPELRYILSFRFIKAVADRNGNSFWEVAAVEKHDAP